MLFSTVACNLRKTKSRNQGSTRSKWSCTVKKRNVHLTSACWLLNVSVRIL
ncbi:hypothetical protein GQ600_22397 [Phytophthora cactorum]|nr:hypothetical protein GQ600_22397 [Phytophthora cactorum]